MWKNWWTRLWRPSMAPAAATAGGATPPEAAHDSPRHTAPLLIDVRQPGEFAAMALRGAINVPLGELTARIDTLAAHRATPLVLYCASGARSRMGCQLLERMGYTDVRNAGGLHAAAATLQVDLR